MKKGFTLIEMLVVVVVLVTLMTMTFRLSSIGSDQSARTKAVDRLQRLENCLSGYYAAYGSYPPVPLHGSRNYRLPVCIHGIQSETESAMNWDWFDKTKHKVKDGSSENEYRDWTKVQAACKAQPIDCCFPFPNDWTSYLDEMQKSFASDGKTANFGAGSLATKLSPYQDEHEWRRVQAFKFGLMSFLLPRYMLMLRGEEELYDDQEQWLRNNDMPCDPITGERFDKRDLDDDDSRWHNVREFALDQDPEKQAHIQNIPSQAVCARWMPNLEGICKYSRDDFKFFGIDIRDGDSKDNPGLSPYEKPETHVPGDRGENCQDGGSSSSGGGGSSGAYVLDRVTVRDGFYLPDENGDGFPEYGEFYYYSPPPYQSYVLWSAGPNGRTFPPWVPRETLDSKARECVEYWTEDDIVIMSH